MAKGKETRESRNLADCRHDEDCGALLTAEQILDGDISEMATDKLKSRLLQRTLLRGSPSVSQLIFDKAEPFFKDFVLDQYGNYLTQKMLEVADAEQFERLVALVKDHTTQLALDSHGTRAVQKVLDQCVTRDNLPLLLSLLGSINIEQLCRCVTGFHVVVQLLENLPAKEVDGVLERLCGTPELALSLSTDQWGCCVAKKCIDRAEGITGRKVVDAIAINTLVLVQDKFGNYVVQHLILSGRAWDSRAISIVDALRGHIFDLALQKESSNVLEKCLAHASDADRNKIINEILNPKDILPSESIRKLLSHQYGNYVFQQALEVAKDPQFSLLVEHSRQQLQYLARISHVEAGRLSDGGLTIEHARRLAVKLVKKYPQLSNGFEINPNLPSMCGQCWPDFGYYDPGESHVDYGCQGMDAYGMWSGDACFPYHCAWDPNIAGALSQGPAPVEGRGNSGSRARSQSRKRAGGNGRWKSGKKACDEQVQTITVGRIVGFWPNYAVTYDEVLAPGAQLGACSSTAKRGCWKPGKSAARANRSSRVKQSVSDQQQRT